MNMASQQAVGTGFRMVLGLVRSLFPTVPRITTPQLEKLLQDEKPPQKLVILDTREPQEIQVSHLEKSIPVDPNLKDMTELLSIINEAKGGPEEQATVVMYCAVGYRASKMTKRLMKELAKPENIHMRKNFQPCNLEGSIFKWANEGRHMVDGKEGKKTKLVHGVDRRWEKLLFPDVVNK